MKLFLNILAFLIIGQQSMAQYNVNKIWYFGEYAGINFNTNPPTFLTNGALQAYDNTSTITDTIGNLIFYTNGVTAWDKNHNIMPNGSGLGGNLSAGQSALIVPQPNSTFYYIFTVGYASADAFRYSIVDISLNGGNGAVISKNNLIFNNSTEKIDAVYNINDTSFWVITHSWGNSQYLCYKLTPQGLQTSTPIVNNIGSIHSGGNPSGYNAIGQMTCSYDGSKLASAIYDDGKIEIFSFNTSTGSIFGTITLSGFFRPWGIALSDNNRFLYYTEWYDNRVWQLDLISGNPTSILASKTLVGTGSFPNTTPGYRLGYFERGPDAKIYVAKFGQNYISSISNPNLAGTACGFTDNAIFLSTKTCNAGLSRTVKFFPKYSIPYCSNTYPDTIYVCSGNTFQYKGNQYPIWSIINDTLIDINGCDSILKIHIYESIPPNINLGNDTAFCTGDSLILSVNGNYSFSWSNGANSNQINIKTGGIYWLKAEDSLCSSYDSIEVIDNKIDSLTINDSVICIGNELAINLPIAYSYNWFDVSHNYFKNFNSAGIYYVEIEDNCKKYTINFTIETKDCNCRIFVPNIFTPDGDGRNDKFYPVMTCNALAYQFKIYNRWGLLIFETSDQDDKWDGTYRGNTVPEGVYFFLIKYNFDSSTGKLYDKVGSVTLLK